MRLAVVGALAALVAVCLEAAVGQRLSPWPRAALSGLLAFAVVGAAALAVHRALLRLALDPLADLSQMIGRGTPLEPSSCAEVRTEVREFAEFARAVDAMLEIHQHAHRDLQRSEAELRLLGQISRIVDRQGDFEAALAACCQLICRFLCWPIGHVYVVDLEDPGRLRPGDIWHVSAPDLAGNFVEPSRSLEFERGAELPGRVLERGEALWVEDVQGQDWFGRPSSEEVRGAVAFPASVANDVMAVVELFDVEPRPREIRSVSLMHNIGLTLGQAMHRRRSNELLLRRHSELARLCARPRQLPRRRPIS